MPAVGRQRRIAREGVVVAIVLEPDALARNVRVAEHPKVACREAAPRPEDVAVGHLRVGEDIGDEPVAVARGGEVRARAQA